MLETCPPHGDSVGQFSTGVPRKGVSQGSVNNSASSLFQVGRDALKKGQ
jgi:hypothetical protein